MPFSVSLTIVACAVFLSTYPFPHEIISYMPSWILILGLLFMYRLPLHFGLGWMFVFGLVNDLLQNVYFGTEALLFLIVGMLFRMLMIFFSASRGEGKIFLVGLFIMTYQVMRVFLFAWLYGQNIFLIQYQPIMLSTLLGTLLLWLLNHFLPKSHSETSVSL